jgi:hypothetical protein
MSKEIIKFSPKQILAIELLAEGANCTTVAEHLHVNKSTVSRWRDDPLFLEAVLNKARENLKSELPSLYVSAASNAKKGSAQHMKIILDHLDNLERTSNLRSKKQLTFTWDLDDTTELSSVHIPEELPRQSE